MVRTLYRKAAPPRVVAPRAPAPLWTEHVPQTTCRVMVLSDAIPNRNGVGTYYRDLLGHLAGHIGHADMIPARANCFFRRKRLSIPVPGDRTQRISWPHVPRILSRIRETRPHVIITPTIGPFAFLAWLLCKTMRIQFIMGHHTSLDELIQIYWSGFKGMQSSRVLDFWTRFLMRSAQDVVVNTHHMGMDAKRLKARRVHCVGTTLGRPFTQCPVSPYHGDVRKVFFAGRLAQEKNVGSLIQAARGIPDLEFVIAGDGQDLPALKAMAAGLDNVQFAGWLSRLQLLKSLDECDLVVLPSLLESFGSIALEGMARGRLVLVSQQCGILDWSDLAEGLYCIGDEEDVAAAIDRIRSLTREERVRKAGLALERTRSMDRKTVAQWIGILESARARYERVHGSS